MSQEAVSRNRERYDQTFALLDEARAKVLALLRTVTQAQADRRPAEGGWSIGEIAEHLALTERAYVGAVADLVANAPAHEYDYAEVLRKRTARVEDAGNVALTGKFVAPPELIPKQGKPLPDLIKGLEDVRTRSKEILAPCRDEDLGVKFFVHRLFGPITLYERLAIVAYHDHKHLEQMETVLAGLTS